MTGFRLYKKEKLCSLTAIDRLFVAPKAKGNTDQPIHSVMAYPWRAVWADVSLPEADCSRFLISVPKKRLRHAVDRVTMRRRMREAYRLHRDLLPDGRHIDIIFIYVADGLTDYGRCCRALKKILSRIPSAEQ